MSWFGPELTGGEMLFTALVVLALMGWMAWHATSGQLVGRMNVTELSIFGIHDKLPVTVRRKVVGSAGIREVRVMVRSTFGVVIEELTEEEAKQAAELLERAAQAASGRA